MDTKAQIGIGAIVTIAIAVIVGLILFQAVATNVEQGTRAVTGVVSSGESYQITAVLDTVVEVPGQELVTISKVQNATGGVDVPTANYTLTECVRKSDNLKGICYTGKGAGANTEGKSGVGLVNISYSYYPNGYIDDAGARSVAGIIILLAAIGIAMIVLAGNRFDWW